MSKNQLPDHLIEALKEREEKGSLRKLRTNFPEIDFCSNDYLGFSKLGLLSAKIRENDRHVDMEGSTGSRLISGNSELFEKTEEEIALFHHAQSALIFNSGYDANLGFFSSVPAKGDLILVDEFIHASVYDGVRLSHASHFKFRHNDINSLNELIGRHKGNYCNIFIAVESVYSMDGDTAPLTDMVDICNKTDKVFLVVDEAHAIGVFGEHGRGLCNALDIEADCFARIYTYGKAMGTHGAAVVGGEVLRDYLINFSRSFIYTTALPVHSIQSITSAYRLLSETKQRDLLRENINYFYSKTITDQHLIRTQGAIHTLIVGSNTAADDLEKELAANNIFVKSIKSPTVRAGTERVRICMHSFNTSKEIDLLVDVINNFCG